MYKKIATLFTMFLLAYSGICFADSFYVVKVYDGDTIKARMKDTDINIRLVGIDAPEISVDAHNAGQPYSREAKEFLEELVLKKFVEIRGYGYLSYNALLGEVFFDGKNVNIEMARAGFCEVIKDADPHDLLDLTPFIDAEEMSRSAKRGVWAQGDAYVSPRDWRGKQVSKSGAAILLYGILQQNEK